MPTRQVSLTLSGISADEQLRYENFQVVSLVQVMLGAISSNMVAISLQCVDSAVNLHFFLQQDSDDDLDLIADIACDLEALQLTAVPIHSHVHIAGSQLDRGLIQGRLVYLRHAGSAA